MSPFNPPRNIRHDEATVFLGFSDRHDTEVGLQSREGIIGHLGPRRRDTRNQRGLANIGITDQPHIGEQLEFQAEDTIFAWPSLFMLTRRLVRGRSKARIPPPTPSTASNYYAFIRMGKIVYFIAGFRVVNNRSYRNFQQNVHAFASLAV